MNKTPRSLFQRDFRQLIRIGFARLFRGPYLPKSLITFFMLGGLTFLAVVLMSQPYEFWANPSHNNSLGKQPVEVLIFGFIALLVGAFLFSVVNYRIALVAWLVVCFADLVSLGSWVKKCSISRWLPINSCADGLLITVIIGSIIIGILVVRNFQFHKPQKVAEDRSPKVWRSLLLPATWLLLLAIGIIWSIWRPSSGWLPIDIQADKLPPPRSGGEIVYDTKRARAVMFGGANAWLGNAYKYARDTWEWDGNKWIEMLPTTIPSERANFGMAYDEKRAVVVMFGGISTNNTMLADTWEWDGKDWHNKECPCSSPTARAWHQMLYDPQRGKIILYGGTNNKGKFFNDGWEWDGTAWHQITFDDQTPAASGFKLIYNPAHKYITAILSGFSGLTWTWQNQSWKRLSPKSQPSSRTGFGIAYEPESKLIFLFGGSTSDLLNDTWTFDGQDWQEYQSTLRPPPLSGAMMFYDPIRKHIVIFGGYGEGVTFHNEMWELVLPKK